MSTSVTLNAVFGIALVIAILGLCMPTSEATRQGRRGRGRNSPANRGGQENSGCNDEGMFQCPEGNCIPDEWKCDNDNDCPNGEDEAGCQTTCAQHDFICRSGQCIPMSWRCDGDNDCPDSSDEAQCPQESHRGGDNVL